jgi:hypothetical protein
MQLRTNIFLDSHITQKPHQLMRLLLYELEQTIGLGQVNRPLYHQSCIDFRFLPHQCL